MNELILKGLKEILVQYTDDPTNKTERINSLGQTINVQDEVGDYFKNLRISYVVAPCKVLDSYESTGDCLAVFWMLNGKVEFYAFDLLAPFMWEFLC